MGACEEMGRIADTLVGGMMFHSDHADLMRLVGIGWLAGLHEDGYGHDSKSYMKVRRACIGHLGTICPTGDQRKSTTLDKVRGRKSSEISAQDRRQLLKSSLDEWAAWESSAADTYSEAAVGLIGNATLHKTAKKLQRSAERELVEALRIADELASLNWDLAHAYEMGGE